MRTFPSYMNTAIGPSQYQPFVNISGKSKSDIGRDDFELTFTNNLNGQHSFFATLETHKIHILLLE